MTTQEESLAPQIIAASFRWQCDNEEPHEGHLWRYVYRPVDGGISKGGVVARCTGVAEKS